jgi:periplasmic divalent cation tolerance protein
MPTNHKMVYITTGSANEAEKIGNSLVEEKLAACVNIFPIKSVYRWKGKIRRESEAAMIIKTRKELVDRVIKRVKELHSYEVPAIVVFNIEKGHKDFLRWIDESTA